MKDFELIKANGIIRQTGYQEGKLVEVRQDDWDYLIHTIETMEMQADIEMEELRNQLAENEEKTNKFRHYIKVYQEMVHNFSNFLTSKVT